MGLVETWIDSRGREGRVKQIETTFEPAWVRETRDPYLSETDQVEGEELLATDSADEM